MSSSVVTLYPVEPAIRAMALMVDYRIRTIPVVNDVAGGKVVVGVVTRRDLTAALEVGLVYWFVYLRAPAAPGPRP
jgi:CBS domain-containing protein